MPDLNHSAVQVHYQHGDSVPFRFHPAFIILSLVASLIGSLATVEVLHRRREGKRLAQYLHHFAVSVSFGLVAIWSMHVIGNRAVILDDGKRELQVFYDPAFTALSALVTVIVLFVGLATVGIRQPSQKFFWPALISAGFIFGLAITGTHYLGTLGIKNYELHFPARWIIGAGAVAVAGSLLALAHFIYCREHWVNSLARRVACAFILAGAASGTHWVASVGTVYVLIAERAPNDVAGYNTNAIIAGIIAPIACAVCMTFAFAPRRQKKQPTGFGPVIIASATFDGDGRILVTSEGLLPHQRIAKLLDERSLEEDLTVEMDVFHWLFRVSFNWAAVEDLIPAMREHLRAIGLVQGNPRWSICSNVSWEYLEEPATSQSMLFREHFCVAASKLADKLKVALTEIGILHISILETGGADESEPQPEPEVSQDDRDLEFDLEAVAGTDPAGSNTGQLMFLVREADKHEAQRLISDGFMFAQVEDIAKAIARSFEVPSDELMDTIYQLRTAARTRKMTLAASTYLAFFAMRPSFGSGFDIMVPAGSPCQLPMVELSKKPITVWQQTMLEQLNGFQIHDCLPKLQSLMRANYHGEQKVFLETVMDGIRELLAEVPAEYIDHSAFCATPVEASGIGAFNRLEGVVQMFAFCIIVDIHRPSLTSTGCFTYVPLSLLRCVQHVYDDSPDHHILARRIHCEFGAVLAHSNLDSAESSRKESISGPGHLMLPSNSFKSSKSSNTVLGKYPGGLPRMPEQALSVYRCNNSAGYTTSSQPAYGGIMVSSDTMVEVRNHEDDDAIELADLGGRAEAGRGAREQENYIDRLARMTTDWFRFQQ